MKLGSNYLYSKLQSAQKRSGQVDKRKFSCNYTKNVEQQKTLKMSKLTIIYIFQIYLKS